MVNESHKKSSGQEMNERSIFQGDRVYLIPPDPETDAGLFARWMQDSEFVRLMDSDPARLLSIAKHKEWLEKELVEEQRNDEIFFLIRTLEDDKPIGLVGLDGIRWVHGDAWVKANLCLN